MSCDFSVPASAPAFVSLAYHTLLRWGARWRRPLARHARIGCRIHMHCNIGKKILKVKVGIRKSFSVRAENGQICHANFAMIAPIGYWGMQRTASCGSWLLALVAWRGLVPVWIHRRAAQDGGRIRARHRILVGTRLRDMLGRMLGPEKPASGLERRERRRARAHPERIRRSRRDDDRLIRLSPATRGAVSATSPVRR